MKTLYKITLFTLFLGVMAWFNPIQAQLFKTQLKVTVIDDAGNLVEGASVQLYANEEDFNKEKNAVTEKLITDDKGNVRFETLEPKVYYILVVKGDMNNWNGGIKTDALQEKKVNKINIIIE